jgi:hypothetical protein
MYQQSDEFKGCAVVGVVCAVVATLALAWVLSVEVFHLAVFAPWAENQKTEIIRNTNSYVATQQAAISGMVHQWDEMEGYEQTEEIDRQQSNLAQAMCDAAAKIDRDQVPERAIPIMEEEGCY